MNSELEILRFKMRALALRLDYDGDTPGAGDEIRNVLNGTRDDREFLTRMRFQALVKSMREVETYLRTNGSPGVADDISLRIDNAVIDMEPTP